MFHGVRGWQGNNEHSLWSIMPGHGHPSSIDSFMSMVFMPLPLSKSTLTVSALSLQGIHFMTV